jgi:hypothetical protein
MPLDSLQPLGYTVKVLFSAENNEEYFRHLGELQRLALLWRGEISFQTRCASQEAKQAVSGSDEEPSLDQGIVHIFYGQNRDGAEHFGKLASHAPYTITVKVDALLKKNESAHAVPAV